MSDKLPTIKDYLQNEEWEQLIIDNCNHKWISVKDRLPDKYGKYLVFCEGFIAISTFYNGAPEPHFVETESTHWMPLPEKPHE
jgi:hypothetical protein